MKSALPENQLTHNALNFTRQIWLAGLGAFAKARQDSSQGFEALVQEGTTIDRQMKQSMDSRKSDPLPSGIEAAKNRVLVVQDRVMGSWNKLEEVFQIRVARALCRLEVPTQDDIQQLLQQMDQLSQTIQELTRVAELEAKTRKIHVTKTLEAVAIAQFTDPVA